MTWCVQPSQPIPMWKNPYMLCRDPVVYIFVIIFIIVVDLLAYFLQQFENLLPKWDCLRLFGMGLCVMCGFSSTQFNPQTNPLRVLTAFGLLCAVLGTTIASSFITLLMASPIYETQIASIHEIIDYHFELVGDELVFVHLQKQNQVHFYKPIVIGLNTNKRMI